MPLNPSVTDLDASQVTQREFDSTNDAMRVNLIAGTVQAINPAIGTNGAPAPTFTQQIGGVGPDGNLHPTSTDNSGNQNVNVVSSVLPSGAATSANQTIEITNLSAINTATTALNLRTAGSLTPVAYDYISIVNVPSGNGVGQPQTVTYKSGGSGGSQVALLTFSYNSDNSLATVTKT